MTSEDHFLAEEGHAWARCRGDPDEASKPATDREEQQDAALASSLKQLPAPTMEELADLTARIEQMTERG